MTQRVGLLNGTNITYDKDLTAGFLAMLNSGVIEGLGISGSGASANVLPGKALIECIRTNGEKVMVFFENTANVVVDLTGTKKLYILVTQAKIDDGSSNAQDGTGIGSIQTGASYPAGDYIPLASITGGVITDARETLTGKNIFRKGFGSGNIIDYIGGNEVIKALSSGSTLLQGDIIRVKKASGDYEEFSISTLSSSVSGLTSEYKFGGSASINDSAYFSALNKYKNTTIPLVDIGKTVAKTSFLMYSSGVAEQRYSFFFTKTLSPQDLTFRIETDNAGVPSGTLVNANAVLVTTIASITTNAVFEIVLPASFNLGPAGTPIHFVFWQGSQAINATNYLSIGVNDEVAIAHDRVTSPGSNLTATRVVGGGAGTTSNATWVQQIDANVNCQLISLGFSYVPNTTLFEVFNVTDNFTIYKDPITQTGVTLNEPVQLLAGKRYELRYTFNNTLNNISSHNTVVNTANINWVNGTAGGNTITSIVTRTATFTENAGILFKYLSKANATNAIKSAVYAMLPNGATAGSNPIIVKDRYIGGFSNLIKGTTYYLSNSGVLSSTAGTVSKVLGVAISTTTIRIDSAINIS